MWSPAGSWLPETAAERHEGVDTAIRPLMERLTPAERAVHLLRTAFDYPCPRISEGLHLSEACTRQLLHRARAHLTTARVRPVSTTAHRRLAGTFRVAADTLDLSELEELLVADVARQVSRCREGALECDAQVGRRLRHAAFSCAAFTVGRRPPGVVGTARSLFDGLGKRRIDLCGGRPPVSPVPFVVSTASHSGRQTTGGNTPC